jgi:CubicO group peptidase (beta-lactamase class C family)
VKRKPLILIVALLLIIGACFILIWWPTGTRKKAKKNQPKEVEVPFLQEFSARADTILMTYSRAQKIELLILSSQEKIDSSFGFGGVCNDLVFADSNYIPPPKKIFKLYDTCFNEHENLAYLFADSISRKHVFTKNQRFYELGNFNAHLFPNYLVSFQDSLFIHPIFKNFQRLLDSSLVQRRLFGFYLSEYPSKTEADFLKSKAKLGLSLLAFKGRNDSLKANFPKFRGLHIQHEDSTSLSDKPDLMISSSPHSLKKKIEEALDNGSWTETELNNRAKRVLSAALWIEYSELRDRNINHHQQLDLMLSKRELLRSSVAQLSRSSLSIPIHSNPTSINVFFKGKRNKAFLKGLSHYTKVNVKSLKHWNEIDFSKYNDLCVLVVSDTLQLDSICQSRLSSLSKKNKLLIVSSKLNSWQNIPGKFPVIFVPTALDLTWNHAAQSIFGGEYLRGGLEFYDGRKLITAPKTRLSYSIALDAGLNPDSLYQINWIAKEGIRNRAFPGCQVSVARNGRLPFLKSYGHLSYRREIPVEDNTLYDLASVTKVASTTMVGMKLYEMGEYNVFDSLYLHLPDSLRKHLGRQGSTLSTLTFHEIYTHNTGLPSGFPILKYLKYTDSITKRLDRYYCDMKDDSVFTIEVAENFFMEKWHQDSIWILMNKLYRNPNQGYVYSDINFNLLYHLFWGKIVAHSNWLENKIEDDEDKNHLEEFIQQELYRKLKMENTCFKPRRWFPKNQIAPTEDDKWWRNCLIQGYVHDPTAALYGGYAGNAGLFSTASDLTIMYQMMLNGGSYAGNKYYDPETIQRFTSRQNGSHRGLGFNKPVGGGMYGIAEQASMSTYGHTGFTGNSVWIDPEEELIFIFLSNRSHPEPHNPKIINLGTRKRMQRAAYSAVFEGALN